MADDEVRAALLAAYESGDWGRYHGSNCPALAAALAEYHRVEHVTLCCSGTLAVELALRGLKVGPGDEVLLAGYDFPGNFRAIEATGARPALVDIKPNTWCVDAELLEAAIGPATKALLVSHLHGGLASMRRIVEIAHSRGIGVVEDACQSPGAMVDGRPAGTWGDVGVLSFGGSKLLTAGRGGAVLTGSAEIAQRVKIFAERGNDAFALSELQAAVLRPQLARLDERNRVRRERVVQLFTELAGLSCLRPVALPSDGDAASYYKVAWLFQGDGRVARDEFLAQVQRQGIALDAGFRGFVLRSERRCRHASSLEHSQQAAAETVLLHHPILLESTSTISRLAAAIRAVAVKLGLA